ncbi:MAG TPA: class III lanthionine synthetase LanKC, partial [Actinomycetota bacterium]
GLDNDGADAVARLERERAILEELSDTDVVPHLLDHFTCWEHHFLVEEYVEGEGLRRAVNARHPQAQGSGNGTAEYTAWALDVGERIERALEALHARGIVYGDLHPENIVVRPDGRVAFVDFEIATHLAENRRPGLGAFGFAAPESCSGFDIDRYALACVRLWTFLTFAPALVSWAPSKAEMFMGVLTERFGVPSTIANQILGDLRVGPDGTGGERSNGAVSGSTIAPGLLDSDAPDWVAVRRSLAETIVASATPERADRLFPGDVNGFRYGGLGLAYGAAGVLYALAAAGAGTDPVHVDWLVRASRRAEQPYVGLYNGLHGVAYALDYLGRHDDAVNVLDRALAPDVPVRGLFGGLAGIGLNLLHFARVTGEGSLHQAALRVAEQLAEAVRDRTTTEDQTAPAGLMHGFCGAALLFVHLYEHSGDTGFLDLAATALRRDLQSCRESADGSLQVAEGKRLMPYLAVGSAGVSVVISEYLRHRGDEDLTSAQQRLLRACDAEHVLFPGLFTGRAGLMASLGLAGGWTDTTWPSAAQAHLRRLAWHALPYRGRVAFPGDQSFRLSMDLATGTAGILLALNTVVGQPDAHEPRSFLPFLGPRQLAVWAPGNGAPVALPGRATSAATP